MNLQDDLRQFTGTEQYHFNPLYKWLKYTDGVKYFAQNAGAYWFLDIVGTEYHDLAKTEPFLVINFLSQNNQATIQAEDGDYKELALRHIDFTDCPEGKYKFFLIDDVLLLSSEY
jgi:hypothetical protein